MANWEKIVVAIIAIGLVFWIWPGVKRGMENSRRGTSREWLGVAAILGLVVLFVLFLIASV